MLFDPDIPKPALILGIAGVVPFFLPALATAGGSSELLHQALQLQFGYAAVILSFLGGVHWGRALAGSAEDVNLPRLIWSVIPSLIGWGLLMLPDAKMIAVGFAIAFTLAFIIDSKASKTGWFPEWYGSLRKLLTTAVLVSFILTLTTGLGIVTG